MLAQTQQVLELRQRGLSDNQIVQELQKKGMSTQQIFDALSQADLMGETPQSSDWGTEPPPPSMQAPQQFAPQQYSQSQGVSEERLQEVAEAIISEKWDEILQEMQKVVAWKERVESDTQSLRDALASLKEEFNQLRMGVLGRVNESDERMREVSSELKAVHGVFKDVIPTFTENVAELSRLTNKVKIQSPSSGIEQIKTRKR